MFFVGLRVRGEGRRGGRIGGEAAQEFVGEKRRFGGAGGEVVVGKDEEGEFGTLFFFWRGDG